MSDLPKELGNLRECWELKLQGLKLQKPDLQEVVKSMSQSVLWSKVCHIHCYGQKYVAFNVMVKGMYCMSQSMLWSNVCTSELMLWSRVCHSQWPKVCHIQCYSQKYVTFNVMVKNMYCMSQSVLWSKVCMSQLMLWSKVS